jgi:hypothetical protein
MIAGAVFGIRSSLASARYRSEARKIVSEGVSATNQFRALEVLLALSSEESANSNGDVYLPGWFLFFLAVGFLVCVALSFPPKVVLGVGKGQSRLQFWRRWLTFLSVTIPSAICSTFLWPWVVDLVKAYITKH